MSETEKRALRLTKSPALLPTSEFRKSHAIIIGINDYGNGIPRLRTARADAERLAKILTDVHGYESTLLVDGVSAARFTTLLQDELPQKVDKNDRLLLYFAGHGIALDGEDGPAGYLVPQDADGADRTTFLPMQMVHDALDKLNCRHCLVILDCCFSGAFRWSSTRSLDAPPSTLYRERYERFLRSPAWQVLTSAAYDEEALDVLSGFSPREDVGQAHSPFALALFDALSGQGDANGDGVLVATELYLYLRNIVEAQVETLARHFQTPGIWPLKKHHKGEFIFLLGEPKLEPAPKLTTENNPYRGLKSYNTDDAELFFGRGELIKELAAIVEANPLTLVLGASGTGKSSLVKAGVLPKLAETGTYKILPPLRPGDAPLRALQELLGTELGAADYTVEKWLASHPEQKILLVVDQFEELVTLCRDEEERTEFERILADLIGHHPDQMRVILTLRTDFKPQFNDSPLLAKLHQQEDDAAPDNDFVNRKSSIQNRYVVPPMTQADLREVIEGPAGVRVLFFESPELVNTLIDEVIQTPGALPLLSFTLEQLYLKYLDRQTKAQSVGDTIERALMQKDYDDLGGVIGSLRTRADEEYEALPDKAHWETMERVMLRMIAVEGGELARRRVPMSELVYPNADENKRVQEVINRLVEARLLVKDSIDVDGDDVPDEFVEPAHDALVRAWDRLLRWKQGFEEYLSLQQTLTAAADEWVVAGSEPKSGLLWNNNPRLPQLQSVLFPKEFEDEQKNNFARTARQSLWPPTRVTNEPTWLNERETEFVRSSVVLRASVLKRVVGITLGVVFVLAGLTLFANIQRGTAINQANRAKVGELTAHSKSNLVVDPELSVLLATNAVENALFLTEPEYASEAADMLRESLWSFRIKKRINYGVSTELRAAAINTAGTQFAIAREDGKVLLHDMRNGILIRTLDVGGNAWIYDIGFNASNPSQLGAIGYWCKGRCEDGATGGFIRIWDISREKAIFSTELEVSAIDLDFSPDTSLIAISVRTADKEMGIQLWDTETRTKVASRLLGDWVLRPTFSPDGESLAALVSPSEISIWDVQLTHEIVRWQAGGEGEEIWNLAMGSEGNIATTDNQGNVSLWDMTNIRSPKLLNRQHLHNGIVFDAVFSSNGKCVATAGESDQKATILIDGSSEPINLLGHKGKVIALAFLDENAAPNHPLTPCGTDSLATIGSDGMLLLWNIGPPEAYKTITAHSESIEDIEFSQNKPLLVTAANDGTARLWNILSFEQQGMLNHGHRINDVDISPDGNAIVTASEDGTAKVWQTSSLTLALSPYRSHYSPVYAASFRPPKGQHIATGYKDGRILLWDRQTGRVIAGGEWKLSSSSVNSIEFNTDGTQLIAGFGDGQSRIIDLLSGNVTVLKREANVYVYHSIFNPKETDVVTADSDNEISLWDITASKNLYEYGSDSQLLGVHQAYVYSIDFDPSGRLLASAGKDGEISIWDIATRKRVNSLPGSNVSTNSVQFSPDGRLLAAGDNNGLIHFYLLDNVELVEHALSRVTRVFTENECLQYIQIECQ